MNLDKEFFALDCWSAPTEEEKINVYGMDFDDYYLIFTDIDGKTPTDPKASIVAACYDDNDAFVWGKEIKDLAALQELRKQYTDDSEFLNALENYTLPKN